MSMGGKIGSRLQSNATTCMPSWAYVTDPSFPVVATAPNNESGPIVPPGPARALAASWDHWPETRRLRTTIIEIGNP